MRFFVDVDVEITQHEKLTTQVDCFLEVVSKLICKCKDIGVKLFKSSVGDYGMRLIKKVSPSSVGQPSFPNSKQDDVTSHRGL